MKDEQFDFYSFVMKNLRWAFVMAPAVFLMTVFSRYMAAAYPQPVIFTKTNERGDITSFGSTVFLPGGFDRYLDDDSTFLYSEAGLLLSLLFLIYSLTRFHRLADIAAFRVVSSDKVAAMRRRLQLAYGCMVGAFTAAALSFMFDTSLTLSVWIGQRATAFESVLTWVSEYYPWIFVGGVLGSLALALWWATTLEFPREVSFRAND